MAQAPPLPARPFEFLHAIGNTPLLRLRRLPGTEALTLLAKAEFLNPGGSVKSRTALGMILAAEAAGALRPGDTILEASSGNEGIALAMIGACRGYRVRIVLPEDVPEERRRMIEAYGGEVVAIPGGATIEDTMRACLECAESMAKGGGVFYARQFENRANPDIHEETTGAEILLQTDGAIDAVVAGVGTGGTLLGVARALKRRYPKIQVVAVEPASAAAMSGASVGMHRQYGIGEGFIPPLVADDLVPLLDAIEQVADDDAYATARALARTEGLMVGVTSGTNVAAALAVGRRLGLGSRVVTFLPDAAERYFSSPLFAP